MRGLRSTGDPKRAIQRLLAVGHTSGADTLLGMAFAQHWLQRVDSRRTHARSGNHPHVYTGRRDREFLPRGQSAAQTPAAISYRIKTLEEQVATQLFLRTTRSVSLTLAGQHLLEHCRQWLNWLDVMPDELQQINAGVERQVNIVINNLLYQPQSAADLLTWLHQQFPFTRFQLSRQVYMGVWDSLLYDDFQLAIGVTGSESLSNNISLLPLGDIRWQFVVAQNHPLATHPAAVLSDDALRRYPAINIEDTSRTLTRRVAWLLNGQKRSRCRISAPSWPAILAVWGSAFAGADVSRLHGVRRWWPVRSPTPASLRRSPLPGRMPAAVKLSVKSPGRSSAKRH